MGRHGNIWVSKYRFGKHVARLRAGNRDKEFRVVKLSQNIQRLGKLVKNASNACLSFSEFKGNYCVSFNTKTRKSDVKTNIDGRRM